MAEQENGFLWSDAWLLLALIYAGSPADRERIIKVGDGINHAIFTDQELDGGLARLQAAGHVIEINERHAPAPTILEWHGKASSKRSAIHKDLERVEGILGIRRKA